MPVLCAVLCVAGAQAQSAQDAQTGKPPLREIQIASGAFTRGTPIPAWVDRLPALPDAGAKDPYVVRLADVHFHLAKEPTVFAHRAMQANETSAVGEIGQYPISFHPDYQRVELHLLRIHRGDTVIDKLASADVRFVQRELGLEYGIYTGSVTAMVVTDDVRAGDTLEIAYSTTGQNPVFAGKFFDAAAWDSPYPLRRRRVTLNVPEDRRIEYRVIGSGSKNVPAVTERREAGRRILRFETQDMPAADIENYVPPDHHAMRWIQFSEFRNWSEVNRWAQGLFDAQVPAAVLENALGGARTARSKADAVSKALEFVQNEIRYLSISIGENSHRPFSPEQVLTRRYGDCKDKTLLLVSMLRQLGIDADPVLVPTYFRKNLDGMLPSPYPFDHAIVRARVDGKVYFLDPTLSSQTGRLDRIGRVHGASEVLVVAPGTNALTTIPVQSGEEQLLNTRVERVSVKRFDQPADMDVRIRYVGMDAEAARRAFSRMSQSQLHKAYEGALARRYPGAELAGEPKIDDDRGNNTIGIEVHYRIANFFENAKDGRLVRYQPVNFTDVFYQSNGVKRSAPLAVPSFPAINRYEFEITLPEDVDARYRPSTSRIDNKAFTVSETLSFSGRTARAELELKVLADRVEPDSMADFVADTRKLGEMMRGAFLIRPVDMKASDLPVAVKPFKELVTERLERVVKTAGDGIADARLAGRDAGAMLCERALASAYLGKTQEALADAQAALRQNPNAAGALRCRGSVHFIAGDFARSEADFSRAVALGLKDQETYFRRGLVSYYLERYDDAAADFAAAQKSAEPAEQARAEYWRVLALRRKPSSSPLQPKGPAMEEWPGPVTGLLGGSYTPDSLLRAAHRETGDALEAALAEAYLAIGQYHLLAGDRIKAKAFFQRAVDKGVLYSLMHAAARHELARMSASR
ncbi:DUF3857 domain-containing protein [Herbaspirillum sp. HC18]|nr:DUF3857 domain-containing protein [Herbaspirillum sp. HC18]